MPRVATSRRPAEPSSPVQKARHRRILLAAGRLGAARGLEGVQMHDVAREARVAVGTLYRYFPSKTHLFAGLLRTHVEALAARTPPPAPGSARADAVADLLVSGGEQLLASPLLTHAMLQSTNALVTEPGGSDLAALPSFHHLLLRVARISDPTPDQEQLLRLVAVAWYGILTSMLNHHVDAAQAASDTRTACRRLLDDLDRPRT